MSPKGPQGIYKIPISQLEKVVLYRPSLGEMMWLPRDGDNYQIKKWNKKHAFQKAKGQVTNTGHVVLGILGHRVLFHRLAWALAYKKWPEGQIDHINGNSQDNRISNLRDIPSHLNQRNMKKNIKNKSGFNGVKWEKRRSKWVARIQLDGKEKYLGAFKTKDEAWAARLAAQRVIGGFTNRQGNA